MCTDKETVAINVVDIKVTDEDLDTNEKLPPGGVIKVLQIIAEADIGSKKGVNRRIHVGGRSATLGKEPSGKRIDDSEEKLKQSSSSQQQKQSSSSQQQKQSSSLQIDQQKHQSSSLQQQIDQQIVPFATQPPLPPHLVPAALEESMDEREQSRKRTRTHFNLRPSTNHNASSS